MTGFHTQKATPPDFSVSQCERGHGILSRLIVSGQGGPGNTGPRMTAAHHGLLWPRGGAAVSRPTTLKEISDTLAARAPSVRLPVLQEGICFPPDLRMHIHRSGLKTRWPPEEPKFCPTQNRWRGSRSALGRLLGAFPFLCERVTVGVGVSVPTRFQKCETGKLWEKHTAVVLFALVASASVAASRWILRYTLTSTVHYRAI